MDVVIDPKYLCSVTIHEEWNTYTKMYINPVIKTLNGSIDTTFVKQQISWLKTIFFFTILVLIHLFIVRTIIKW